VLQVRKLEFILSEGLRDKCNVMITGGGLQSNHARTTAVASREVGMDSHLILYTYDQKQAQENVRGNLLLCKLTGACIGTIPPIPSDKRLQAYDDIFSNTQNLLNGQGYNAQSMRLGGATPLGSWGYIEAFKEMIEQVILIVYQWIY
jgi:D-cysteine desulfhydrase